MRDNLNNPVPNAAVSIIFAGTGTSIRPDLNQWPGVTDRCSMHEIDTVADASGHAQIVPRLGRYGEQPVVPVFADQYLASQIGPIEPVCP